HEAIKALEVAGQSAGGQDEYFRALEHFRAAAALTSEERDPVEWARVQGGIASVQLMTGHYYDAERIYRRVNAVYQSALGPEDADTVACRMHLATALLWRTTSAEA